MAEQVVSIKQVSTSSGVSSKGPWARYDVETAGGTRFQTFKDDLGSQARNLTGQTAKIVYHEETRTDKNGVERTNNVIDFVSAAAQNFAGAAAQVFPINFSHHEDDRQLRIMRQSALERAILVYGLPGWELSDPTDLYDLADEFLRYFQEGQQAPVEAVETVKL